MSRMRVGAPFKISLALLVVALAALLLEAQGRSGRGAPAAADTVEGPRRVGQGALLPLGPTTEPRPRDDARHRRFLEIARAGNIDLLFVGDSITDRWRREDSGLAAFTEHFGGYRTANFGVPADTIQETLWRLQNGQLDGFEAKLIVFMLGTNNINRNRNADIAEGNRAIIAEFHRRQPQAKVLLLGVFPRGARADNPYRASVREINARLAMFADHSRVFYMDIGDRFLAADGTLPTDIMPDRLHPSQQGYRIWAEAIAPKVKELME